MIAGVVHVSSENLMIIGGLADLAARPYRSFSKIFSCRVVLFLKSSAMISKIFRNLQLMTRSFFEILSYVINHF